MAETKKLAEVNEYAQKLAESFAPHGVTVNVNAYWWPTSPATPSVGLTLFIDEKTDRRTAEVVIAKVVRRYVTAGKDHVGIEGDMNGVRVSVNMPLAVAESFGVVAAQPRLVEKTGV